MSMKNYSMNVLSVFDGMSCFQIALNRCGIKYNKYWASEIDSFAIKIARKNYPNIIHFGDITKIRKHHFLHDVDFLVGGSPCQGFSFAGKGLNFDDPRSKLFFEFVRLKKELNPKWFLLENVKMKKEHEKVITDLMGVEPIMINSALVSAQQRKRLYWTNIEVITQPQDKGILLDDILINGVGVLKTNGEYKIADKKSNCCDANYYKGLDNHQQRTGVYLSKEEIEKAKRNYAGKTWHTGNKMGNMVFPDKTDRKSKTITATRIKSDRATIHIKEGDMVRMLYPIEYERLQTVPDNYTKGVSDSQRYKMLGNGFTIDVICHILSFLPKEYFANQK